MLEIFSNDEKVRIAADMALKAAAAFEEISIREEILADNSRDTNPQSIGISREINPFMTDMCSHLEKATTFYSLARSFRELVRQATGIISIQKE